MKSQQSYQYSGIFCLIETIYKQNSFSFTNQSLKVPPLPDATMSSSNKYFTNLTYLDLLFINTKPKTNNKTEAS